MSKSESFSTRELSLQRLIEFALSEWKTAGKFLSIISLALVGIWAYWIPYTGSSTLLISDAQTSQSQAFSNNFFALSKTQTSSRKNQSSSSMAVDFLTRQNSFGEFAKQLAKNSNTFSPDEMAIFNSLANRWKLETNSTELNWKRAAKELASLVKFSSNSPSELQVNVRSRNKDLSVFLISQYSKFAVEELKQQEKQEIAHVREALVGQKEHFRANFDSANKELVAFQSRPENVFTLTSGSSLGSYITELVARKNDIDLKIAENDRILKELGGRKAILLAAKRKLGARSDALQLEESTRMLKKERSAVQASIKKFTTASNGYAEALRMHDELKKVTQREFTNFQETNDLLSKLDVYEISIASKFELLHFPEQDEIQKATSLYMVLAIALFLSQLLFASYVYYFFQRVSLPRTGRPTDLALVKKPLLQVHNKITSTFERETIH